MENINSAIVNINISSSNVQECLLSKFYRFIWIASLQIKPMNLLINSDDFGVCVSLELLLSTISIHGFLGIEIKLVCSLYWAVYLK